MVTQAEGSRYLGDEITQTPNAVAATPPGDLPPVPLSLKSEGNYDRSSRIDPCSSPQPVLNSHRAKRLCPRSWNRTQVREKEAPGAGLGSTSDCGQRSEGVFTIEKMRKASGADGRPHNDTESIFRSCSGLADCMRLHHCTPRVSIGVWDKCICWRRVSGATFIGLGRRRGHACELLVHVKRQC